MHFKNVTSSPLPFFWPLYTSKKQIYCFEILYACCLYVFRSHIFRFLDNLKISYFIGIHFWKIEFLNFGRQNNKISKTRQYHFIERSILCRWRFLIALTLKLNILAAFKHLLFFLPKMAKHDVTKTPLFQKLLDGFFWNCGCRR